MGGGMINPLRWWTLHSRKAFEREKKEGRYNPLEDPHFLLLLDFDPCGAYLTALHLVKREKTKYPV